ncbi:MAG: DMT family transporter [Flavihumibacter sp.]|nr:DMT family transporter [Flavihumibacter sp.]
MKKAFLQLHIAVFLAGFTGLLGRLITLNEAMLVWYRLLLSAATMWCLFGYQKKIQPISKKEIAAIIGVGGIAALHWLSFYGSIKYSNISVALVCFSAVGFFTAVFEPLINNHRFNKIDLLLGLLVMLGIYIIFQFDPSYKIGIAVGLVSALLGALFPVYNRRFMQRMNAETLLTWQMSGGFLVLTALLPLYLFLFPTQYFIPVLSDWFWLLVLSWLCSVWAFHLSANALKKISAFTVNLTYNLEPVYGILLAFVVYHENKELKNSFYFGLAIILMAVLLQTARIYKQHKK